MLRGLFKLLIFGFYENDKIIGFSQCLYFKKESFITIDYFVISSSHRGNHSFQMIIAILKEFLKEYKLEFNFIVTEVESKNKSLLQLLKMNGFELFLHLDFITSRCTTITLNLCRCKKA